MGIIETFRTLKILNKAAKFIKSHEQEVVKAQELFEKVKKAIEVLQLKQELIQKYLDKGVEILAYLKRMY